MPVYEYECTSCGQTFERLQSVSARPPRTCPHCQKAGTVRRRVSAPAFQFKGSGWYVTDYAGKGKAGKKGEGATAESSDGKSAADKEGKSGAEKEAKKPEPKTAKASGKGDD
jgi:putative FmdB family regulatory protein